MQSSFYSFLLFETLKQGVQNDLSTNETTLNKRTALVCEPRWFNSLLLFLDTRLTISTPLDSLRKKIENTAGPNLLTLLRNVRDDGQEWAELRRYCGKREGSTFCGNSDIVTVINNQPNPIFD